MPGSRRSKAALLDEALNGGTVAVIPGFQGVSDDGRVATLGRGGSDTSAVAIAAGVKADRCDIYTDVDGVYTTDPRIVPKARKLDAVTFEEMLELAGVGVEGAAGRARSGLPCARICRLRVLSAFEDVPGTEIVAELGADMERNAIAGIAADRNEARVTLTGIADRPGMVAAVITPLAEAGISVDMIVHAATAGEGRSDLTFTVPRASLAQAMAVLEKRKEAIGFAEHADRRRGRQGGDRRRRHPLQPGAAARKCSRRWPSGRSTCSRSPASEIKVSALIAEDQMELAVRRAAQRLRLDAEAAAPERRHERRRADRGAARRAWQRGPRQAHAS